MMSRQQYLVIIATSMISAALGSIHAFSVFIAQWESLLGVNRANVSLIYSVALVTLTLSVLYGYRLYGNFRPPVLLLFVGIMASSGLYLSASATSLFVLYLSYGILFGGANGLGYGYALQLAGQASNANRGLAMGLVTAFYAVGATVTPKLFIVLIAIGGNALALKTMSVIILVAAVVAAYFLKQSDVQFYAEQETKTAPLSAAMVRIRLRLWSAYGCAVVAGLMVIGHSHGIALWANLNMNTAVWATTFVALGNMLGGFSVGIFVDRLSSQRLLQWLPVLSTAGLVMLIWWPDQSARFLFLALALIGYSYGAIIAVYPVAVADVFGSIASPRIYGQVFTAWGLAGLVGPWASGWIFDLTQSYSLALLLAVLMSCASMVLIRTTDLR